MTMAVKYFLGYIIALI